MGTLSDREIRTAIQNGELIVNGQESQASGVCYELRMGNVYYDLTEDDKRIALTKDEFVLIKPGHRVVLITHEALSLPDDTFARVVSKGSLFSIGLSPVATYADPGFSGKLGIVTQNISDKYIKLPMLESIAKVDFTRLSEPVEATYRGQHGFDTEIWPIKHHLQTTYGEVSSDRRVTTEEEEAYKLLPNVTATVLRGLVKRHKTVDIAIGIILITNVLVLSMVTIGATGAIVAVVGNLVASIIAALVIRRLEKGS